VEGDRGETSADRQRIPGQRQHLVQQVELPVDGDPQRLEAALGRVAATEALRGGSPRLHRGDQLGGGAERAAGDDLVGDPTGMALLAEVAQHLGDPPLWPLVDEVGGAEVLARVHPHVERRVVGVGEAPLPSVDLHR
jgi:hypothetical protein